MQSTQHDTRHKDSTYFSFPIILKTEKKDYSLPSRTPDVTKTCVPVKETSLLNESLQILLRVGKELSMLLKLCDLM